MAKISMTIPHNLSKLDALVRIKGMLKQLKAEQAEVISNVKEEWDNDQGNFAFSAKGYDLAGVIKVNPSSVDINAKVPFAVGLFSGRIKNLINEKAKSLLQ